MSQENGSTLEVHLSGTAAATTIVARTHIPCPGLSEGDPISVRIRRHEPDAHSDAGFSSFVVPYQRDMRIIDLLHVLSDRGESIAYRWFCSTKKCGGCGMKVNGEPRLVCWEAVDCDELVIEPLDNFPVVRDLVVDRVPGQARCLSMKPYIERNETPPFPEPLTHKEIEGSYRLMDCIECGICTSTCPAYTGPEGVFPGPWVLVQAAKFARDPRDKGDRAALIEKSGVDRCMSCYRCEQVCPLHIPIVTEAIMPLRGMAARSPGGSASHPKAFAENIRKNGFVHSPTLFLRTHGVLGGLRAFPLAMKMLSRGKMKVLPPDWKKAREGVEALFKEADEKVSR